MSDYLILDNVTKTYPSRGGVSVVVKDFNLRLRKGEFVCLIGHSGCGKSTVLSMVAGLNDMTSGGMILAGKELQGAGPDRGVVFQSPCLLPWLTAIGNVMLHDAKFIAEMKRRGWDWEREYQVLDKPR